MLIVTDIFDLNMLTESCDLEFKAIDLATAIQLLKVVPYEVVWSSDYYTDVSPGDANKLLEISMHMHTLSREVEAIKLHYDTTVLVIDAHYKQARTVISRIWLITPIKFT